MDINTHFYKGLYLMTPLVQITFIGLVGCIFYVIFNELSQMDTLLSALENVGK